MGTYPCSDTVKSSPCDCIVQSLVGPIGVNTSYPVSIGYVDRPKNKGILLKAGNRQMFIPRSSSWVQKIVQRGLHKVNAWTIGLLQGQWCWSTMWLRFHTFLCILCGWSCWRALQTIRLWTLDCFQPNLWLTCRTASTARGIACRAYKIIFHENP